MILHLLEGLAVFTVVSAPTWVIWRVVQRKFPVNGQGHCWHTVYEAEEQPTFVRCCYCGLEFDALAKIGQPDHGKHAPKTWYPTPPMEDCAKRPKPE